MKIAHSKHFCNAKSFTFVIILLLSQSILSAQITPAPIPSDSVQSQYSNFSIGLIMGYSGLFAGSNMSKSAFDNDYVNGYSMGILLEYKINESPLSIQLMSEFTIFSERLDKRYIKNQEYYYSNTLGFKYQPDFAGDLYLLPTLGVLYFDKLQFQGGLSIGYEFKDDINKRRSYYYQLGYAMTEKNDGMLMLKFGMTYKL